MTWPWRIGAALCTCCVLSSAVRKRVGPVNTTTIETTDTDEALRILDICQHLASMLSLQLQSLEHQHEGKEISKDGSFTLEKDMFVTCGSGARDLSALAPWGREVLSHSEYIRTISEQGRPEQLKAEIFGGPPLLTQVGKLAKGGTFFKSADGRYLVKGISPDEGKMLDHWAITNFVNKNYHNCSYFTSTTRLVPYLLRFKDGLGQQYLVMHNETNRLQKLFGSSWKVSHMFDIKPLPSLSGDLVPFLRNLQKLTSLQNWKGWDTVQIKMSQDAQILDRADVVDYSFFIHLLDRGAGAKSGFANGLPPGCILHPGGHKSICVSIIDYATYYSFGRLAESMLKGDKFQAYGRKFMNAFACFGNLNADGCMRYRDLTLLKSVENSNSSQVRYWNYVRTDTFRTRYDCTAQEPRMRWMKVVANGNTIVFDAPDGLHNIPTVQMMDASGEWVDRDGHQLRFIDTVHYLTSNSILVNEHFMEYLDRVHSMTMTAEFVSQKYGKSGRRLKKQGLEACRHGIAKFATAAGWFFQPSRKHVADVLWSPASQSVMSIRTKPTGSNYDRVVTDMRHSGCFLKIIRIRCSPKDGSKVMFDYETQFGTFDMLMVHADRYSNEFTSWIRR